MILAQATTHANPLYQEWGLIVAAWCVCVPLFGCVFWLLKLKSKKITDSALNIRSILAGLMEQTFQIEALRVLELIDDHLPYVLSQVDADNPRASAFDRLCLGLRDLDANEPDRVKYRTLLELALSRIISTEAKKLLAGPTPTRLRFSFRHETERMLAYIAAQTTRSRKRERGYHRATKWTTIFFVTAIIAAFLAAPWVMVDATWAFLLDAVCLSVFLLAVVAGCASLLVVAVCQTWITTHAEWRVEDWLNDLP